MRKGPLIIPSRLCVAASAHNQAPAPKHRKVEHNGLRRTWHPVSQPDSGGKTFHEAFHTAANGMADFLASCSMRSFSVSLRRPGMAVDGQQRAVSRLYFAESRMGWGRWNGYRQIGNTGISSKYLQHSSGRPHARDGCTDRKKRHRRQSPKTVFHIKAVICSGRGR